jgi:predicted short-subunit dehydrogenase-like oxidoreductase (DUF2520 family)
LCALEGDAAALPLQDFAAAIGARPFALAPGGKAAYHAALSVASNYLVTLTDIARQLARQGGVDEALLSALLGPLMRGSLANALSMGTQQALTGPIVRGDAATVARHLAVLPPDLQPVYRRWASARWHWRERVCLLRPGRRCWPYCATESLSGAATLNTWRR